MNGLNEGVVRGSVCTELAGGDVPDPGMAAEPDLLVCGCDGADSAGDSEPSSASTQGLLV